jgi:sulfate/thiosulfate transport system substrate-binding protein
MVRISTIGIVLTVLVAAAVASVTSNDASARPAGGSISLVAYSTPRDAYAEIIPEFQKTAKGKDVDFEQSYGASGEQARAVKAGLKADIVALSLEPDVTTLVKAGLINPKWKQNKWQGIVTRSVVVFVVRRGNPKKIKDWEDLTRSGVDVVTPNVQTSGGAKWNVMAAYGAMRKKGRSHKQAVAYLRNLYKHVVSQDKSAREALQTFLAGRGDVLLAYENEAIFANSKGQDVPYVIPKATIRIENPIAILKTSKNKAAAGAFLNFLRTPKAQKIYGENGYRPVLVSALRTFKFPVRPWLFTIKSLGGWASVDKRFFDPKTGIVTKIQKETG